MKTKFALIFIFALLATACAATNAKTTESIGPINSNYANAASPSEQLIVGVLKLEGTDLAVTSQQASQLVPLLEAYNSLASSNNAAQAEIQAVLNQIETTLTDDQTQAIVKMKLTSQDLANIAQGQNITSTSKTSKSVSTNQAGGPPDGGDILIFGSAPVTTSSTTQTKTANQSSAMVSKDVVDAVLKALQNKINTE